LYVNALDAPLRTLKTCASGSVHILDFGVVKVLLVVVVFIDFFRL